MIQLTNRSFSYSKTFHKDLKKLDFKDRDSAKETCLKYQFDPSSKGFNKELITEVKRKNLYSLRVTGQIRIILHEEENSTMFMRVNQHDYKAAHRLKVKKHPVTKSLQFYEDLDIVLDEYSERINKEKTYVKVSDINELKYEDLKKEQVFKNLSEDQLLKIGVPQDWTKKVQELTEEDFEFYLEKLPEEASEALEAVYLGEDIKKLIKNNEVKNIDEHPDTLRRFTKIENIEELNHFFDQDWESWLTFLHPEQREAAYINRNGSAKISGSAGTGKTVVSLHRALHLAKHDNNKKILLVTYSNTLARDLKNKVNLLFKTNKDLISKIKVSTINKEVRRLFPIPFSDIVPENHLKKIIKTSIEELNIKDFDIKFLFSEWINIIDSWDIITFDEYKNFLRVGRGTQIGLLQRTKIWKIFENVRKILQQNKLQTWNSAIGVVARKYSSEHVKPYTNVIVDEAQDLEPIGLKFLRSIVNEKENDLFFSGDLGQRIYKKSFSWLKSGVDIRGRSNHLKINYRTSKQIFKLSDLLVPDQIIDDDGNTEDRKGIISTFDGPEPSINFFNNEEEEANKLSQWLSEITSLKKVHNEEIALLCRTKSQFNKAIQICNKGNLPYKEILNDYEPQKGSVSIMTMHRSKGLEFRTVAIFSCNYDILPLSFALKDAEDDVEKKQIIKREEFLLYVACSRAREYLWLSSSAKPSEFIEFLNLSKDH